MKNNKYDEEMFKLPKPELEDLDELDDIDGGIDPAKNTKKPVNKTVQIVPKTTTVAKKHSVKAIVQKMRIIEAELNQVFFEREEVVRDSFLALVTKQNLFMYGPPGTGKSALTNAINSRIVNSAYFYWLLNRTSDVSEVVGPYSIAQMEHDKFIRITDGKLVEADIGFIDEVWKANEPVLNMMLPIMNERIFFNDGKAHKIPLLTLFGASNEFPEDSVLAALYDRFMFREDVEPIKDASSRIKMYKVYSMQRNKGVNFNAKTFLTLDELYFLQNTCGKVKVPDDILTQFEKMLLTITNEGIIVSDRRRNKCIDILQGSALYNCRNTVTEDDFVSLKNVLWNDLAEIPTVDNIIMKMVNVYQSEINNVMKQFNEIKETIAAETDDSKKTQLVIENKNNFQMLIKKLGTIGKQAKGAGKQVSTIIDKKQEIKAYSNEIMNVAFNIEVEDEDEDEELSPTMPNFDIEGEDDDTAF